MTPKLVVTEFVRMVYRDLIDESDKAINYFRINPNWVTISSLLIKKINFGDGELLILFKNFI